MPNMLLSKEKIETKERVAAPKVTKQGSVFLTDYDIGEVIDSSRIGDHPTT